MNLNKDIRIRILYIFIELPVLEFRNKICYTHTVIMYKK